MLRAIVRVKVKLGCRVPIDVAVEAGDAEARLERLAIIGRIELLLRKRRNQ